MSVLVVGGAGYIGSHVVRLLEQAGADVVVVDDLSTPGRVAPEGVGFVRLDIAGAGAEEALVALMRERGVRAVIHFAAKKQVGESVANPLYYYRQNVGGLVTLLSAMQEAGVKELIFSSSAAVYGLGDGPIVDETSSTHPINPYGATKLIGEWLLADCERAWGLRWVALRYFNVAGAGWSDISDKAALNLVPMVLERLVAGEAPRIFGDDYDTPDGTCVRDYVHVLDLAEAHIAALRDLEAGGSSAIYNVGTGEGSSVREVIEALQECSGIDLAPVVVPRRPGDPPMLVADASRIEQRLGVHADLGLSEIVASAWQAWQDSHLETGPQD